LTGRKEEDICTDLSTFLKVAITSRYTTLHSLSSLFLAVFMENLSFLSAKAD
jgi:hypothetical protein